MIVLDTNVISELMRQIPHHSVRRWLNGQPEDSLFVTTISVTELRYGIERLPTGRRKTFFWETLNFMMANLFDTRILSFDLAAAEEAARLTAIAESVGKPIDMADCQIAAITKTRGFSIATRDTAPFEIAGINIIDPWLWK